VRCGAVRCRTVRLLCFRYGGAGGGVGGGGGGERY